MKCRGAYGKGKGEGEREEMDGGIRRIKLRSLFVSIFIVKICVKGSNFKDWCLFLCKICSAFHMVNGKILKKSIRERFFFF